jgi:hypothetical protein
MYPILLGLHNIARWAALILGIVVTVQAFSGWFGKREWSVRDRKLGAYFGMTMDIQLLLGLLLFIVFSPITRSAFQDFGAAMQVSDVAFFLVEHPFAMLLAVVFAHVGSIQARKAPDSPARFKRAAIWYTLAVLLMILGMPWGRPIFPGLG